MKEKIIEIHFPRKRVEEPIISDLIRETKITLNILKAQVTPNEEGMMLVSLSGTDGEIKDAIKTLDGKGVTTKLIKNRIIWQEESCTHCGACLSHCPTKALKMKDDGTSEVAFDNNRCIMCELCLNVCPYRAVRQSS